VEAKLIFNGHRISSLTEWEERKMAVHLIDEPRLVQAAKSGDDEAFRILFNHYYPNVFRVVVRITRNNEDAEDALQEALLKAYCNLKQFQGHSQFYTWLVRITMNEALMNLRKRRYTQVPLEEVVETEKGTVRREFEDRSNDPERRYAEQELRETLAQALESLSPRLCAAFVLRNVEEMSMRETAAVLGLSASAVKSRVVRARSRLRKRLRKTLWAQSPGRPASQQQVRRAPVKHLTATPQSSPLVADAAA
jgi:RNA polymerase sigma-70 factor, ECF subfamily